MSDDGDIPQAIERRPAPRVLQLVWLVPLAAALVGGWLAFKAVWERGPTITIQFKSGEGIEAGKTRIKHKAVDIGTVRAVRLAADRKSVIVSAEIDRAAAQGFLVQDTRFWVVRPRIAGGQVSGLGTLLAGSYIGSDPGRSEDSRRDFEGLETPPAVTSDEAGRQYLLRADELGSLDIGSPVYFRGVNVGRVVSTVVAPDGASVLLGAFVQSPYDQFVRDETRFWNASGVDFALDVSGVKIHSQSLLTLVLGGVAFETPPEAPAAKPSAANAQFRLWDSRAEAMRPRESVVWPYRMVFEQSVRGLTVGAALDFRGITVGEVSAITLHHDPDSSRFYTVIDIQLWPERLRVNGKEPSAQRMQRFVERGMRGQLRSANLITGQMYVALDFFPKAPPAQLDLKKSPPEIPTIATDLAELQESLGNIVKSLERVPFDKIAADLRQALAALGVTLKRADGLMAQLSAEISPELRATLEQARRTFKSAEGALASDSPLQGDLREALNQVTRAAETVRALADYLERHPESLIRGRREGSDKP